MMGNGADNLMIIDKYTFSYNTDKNSNLWHLVFSFDMKYHASANIDQQGVIAANQIEQRHRRQSMKKKNAHLLPQSCSPSCPWVGGTRPFLPADGGSYLGCSLGESTLLAWVDCLCLDRKDWAGPGALECSHRLCCCRAEDCKRQKQLSAVSGNTVILRFRHVNPAGLTPAIANNNNYTSMY